MPSPQPLAPLVATLCALAAPAAALDQLNLILPNPRNLPMGDTGSVEAGAVVGRTTGAAAAWYNPAGVPGEERREVTASTSIFDYQRTAIESPYSSDERRTLTIVPRFRRRVGADHGPLRGPHRQVGLRPDRRHPGAVGDLGLAAGAGALADRRDRLRLILQQHLPGLPADPGDRPDAR